MPVIILGMCLVGVIFLVIYFGIKGYNTLKIRKYGPAKKDIDFEGKRFSMLKYLSTKETTINRLNVIEELEFDIPTFKCVVNSLVRDKLVKTGPQSIKITLFGKEYHDVFLK